MRWISVNERLPDICETVILSYNEDKAKVTVGWLESMPDENPLFYSCELSEWPEHVTHWMPLPEGIEEEEKEWVCLAGHFYDTEESKEWTKDGRIPLCPYCPPEVQER